MNIQNNKLYLPRTGQVTSYATGDDGYFQAGNPRKTRFYDNGNGTISDRATGLMWVKQPELIIPGAVGVHSTNQIQVAHGNWAYNHAYALAELCRDAQEDTFWVCVATQSAAGSGTFSAYRTANPTKWRQTIWIGDAFALGVPRQMTWADAVANCLALEYAGFSDWRLPNLLELLSILNVAAAELPAVYADGPILADSVFWTSSTYAPATDYAFYVASGVSCAPAEKIEPGTTAVRLLPRRNDITLLY